MRPKDSILDKPAGALFLTRFNFIITHRPGNRNCKADALSRLYSLDAPSDPEPILPPALIVSPIFWNIDKESVGLSSHPPSTAVQRHKSFADARRAPTPNYHPGDQVWLSTRDLRLRLPCRKLSPRYIGPFTIQRQINEVTYQLQLPPRYRIHPTFHVSLLKPFSPSTPEPHEPDESPPPPEILDQPSVYRVRDIMDSW